MSPGSYKGRGDGVGEGRELRHSCYCTAPRHQELAFLLCREAGMARDGQPCGAGSQALGGCWGGGLLLGEGEIEPLTLPLQVQGSPSASLPHFSCPCPLPLHEVGSDPCPHV